MSVKMRLAKPEEEEEAIEMEAVTTIGGWNFLRSTKLVRGLNGSGYECEGTLVFVYNVGPESVNRVSS